MAHIAQLEEAVESKNRQEVVRIMEHTIPAGNIFSSRLLNLRHLAFSMSQHKSLEATENAGIVKNVVSQCLSHSPDAVYLIISNPMDTLTYLTLKATGLPKNKVIGMGGIVDGSRFKYYLSRALKVNPAKIEGLVIGGHGDTIMVPLKRLATYNGIPVSTMLDADVLDKVVADTMVGGATITSLVGASASYGPGAAGAYVTASIVHNYRRLISSCVYLEGEYGQNDICIGVPAIIGRNGVESIVDVQLNDEEKALFEKSANAVRKTNEILKEIGAL